MPLKILGDLRVIRQETRSFIDKIAGIRRLHQPVFTIAVRQRTKKRFRKNPEALANGNETGN
jgi:hypothetical protein